MEWIALLILAGLTLGKSKTPSSPSSPAFQAMTPIKFLGQAGGFVSAPQSASGSLPPNITNSKVRQHPVVSAKKNPTGIEMINNAMIAAGHELIQTDLDPLWPDGRLTIDLEVPGFWPVSITLTSQADALINGAKTVEYITISRYDKGAYGNSRCQENVYRMDGREIEDGTPLRRTRFAWIYEKGQFWRECGSSQWDEPIDQYYCRNNYVGWAIPSIMPPVMTGTDQSLQQLILMLIERDPKNYTLYCSGYPQDNHNGMLDAMIGLRTVRRIPEESGDYWDEFKDWFVAALKLAFGGPLNAVITAVTELQRKGELQAMADRWAGWWRDEFIARNPNGTVNFWGNLRKITFTPATPPSPVNIPSGTGKKIGGLIKKQGAS